MNRHTATARQQIWIEHFGAWSNSGLSKADFCKQHDIKKADFYRWNNRLSKLNLIELTTTSQQGGFLPIEVVEASNELIQIKANGIEVNFPASVSRQSLQHLLCAMGLTL